MRKEDVIITIGRQTGSGGREVGKRLAKKLGVKCYDRELLELAAKEGGFDQKIVEKHDEKPTTSFLYSLYMGSASYGYGGASPIGDMPLDHRIFLAQFDSIRKIAGEGSCVIVGRCADYALEENSNVISVFILGDEEDRISRMAERLSVSREKAREEMIKTDKKRSSYYNYYANRKWGSAGNYDLCLNSSVFGIDGCVDVIMKAAETQFS